MLFQNIQQQQQSYFCQDEQVAEPPKAEMPVYFKEEEDEEEDEAAVAAEDESEFNYCDDPFADYALNTTEISPYNNFIEPQQPSNFMMYPQQQQQQQQQNSENDNSMMFPMVTQSSPLNLTTTTTLMPTLVSPLPTINNQQPSVSTQMNPLLSHNCQQQQQTTFPTIITQMPTTQIPVLNNSDYMTQNQTTSNLSSKPQRKRKRKSTSSPLQQQSPSSLTMITPPSTSALSSNNNINSNNNNNIAIGYSGSGSGNSSSSGNSSGEEKYGKDRRIGQGSGNAEVMESGIAKLETGELLGKDDILLLSGDQIEDYIYAAKTKLRLSTEQMDFLKKYRRLIKNKEYAQQSRDKKKKYIFELESELNSAISSISKLQQDINDLSIKNAQLETENRSLHEELSLYKERWGNIIHTNPLTSAPIPLSSSSSSTSPSDSASNSPDNTSLMYASSAAAASASSSSSMYGPNQRSNFFIPMFAVCLIGLCLGLVMGPLAGVVPGLSGFVGGGSGGNSTVDFFTNTKGTGRTLKSEVAQGQQNSFLSWIKSVVYRRDVDDLYQNEVVLDGGQYDGIDGGDADGESTNGGNDGDGNVIKNDDVGAVDDEEKILPYSELLIKNDLLSGKVHNDQNKDDLKEIEDEKDIKNE